MTHPTTLRKWARRQGLDPDFAPPSPQPQGADKRATARQHAEQLVIQLRAQLDAAETEIRQLRQGRENLVNLTEGLGRQPGRPGPQPPRPGLCQRARRGGVAVDRQAAADRPYSSAQQGSLSPPPQSY